MDGKSTEQITLNAETYDNILSMINSVDQENKTVALSCIENVDFSKNLVYIMLLMKQGTATPEDWRTNAPKIYEMLQSAGLDPTSVLTYKEIIHKLVARKVPPEDIGFYMDKFINHVHSSIKNLGYDYIEKINITLKLKTPDGEQIRTISES